MVRFSFFYNHTDSTPRFHCTLKSIQCEGQTKIGLRCKRNVVRGTPYCWSHLFSAHKLRIGPSRIQGAGMGLFASTSRVIKNPPVRTAEFLLFKRDEKIVEYKGELINDVEKQSRIRRQNCSICTAAYNGAHWYCGCCMRAFCRCICKHQGCVTV